MCTGVLLSWQLTSETMRPSFVLSFVRFAVLLNTLVMPISGRRLCREYDCSSLNFGKATSSLLYTKNADKNHLFTFADYVQVENGEKRRKKLAVSRCDNRNEQTHIFCSCFIHLWNLLAVISSSMTV